DEWQEWAYAWIYSHASWGVCIALIIDGNGPTNRCGASNCIDHSRTCRIQLNDNTRSSNEHVERRINRNPISLVAYRRAKICRVDKMACAVDLRKKGIATPC